jgi:hypothetical protein
VTERRRHRCLAADTDCCIRLHSDGAAGVGGVALDADAADFRTLGMTTPSAA